MLIFNQVKKALRITHNKLDDDIRLNINAALSDLASAGVDIDNHETDEAVIVAVTLYCRWIYNQLELGEQWRQNYEDKKKLLSLDIHKED